MHGETSISLMSKFPIKFFFDKPRIGNYQSIKPCELVKSDDVVVYNSDNQITCFAVEVCTYTYSQLNRSMLAFELNYPAIEGLFVTYLKQKTIIRKYVDLDSYHVVERYPRERVNFFYKSTF